jgi:hypothetical protein
VVETGEFDPNFAGGKALQGAAAAAAGRALLEAAGVDVDAVERAVGGRPARPSRSARRALTTSLTLPSRKPWTKSSRLRPRLAGGARACSCAKRARYQDAS